MITSSTTCFSDPVLPFPPPTDLQDDPSGDAANRLRMARLRRVGLTDEMAALVALLAYGEGRP